MEPAPLDLPYSFSFFSAWLLLKVVNNNNNKHQRGRKEVRLGNSKKNNKQQTQAEQSGAEQGEINIKQSHNQTRRGRKEG